MRFFFLLFFSLFIALCNAQVLCQKTDLIRFQDSILTKYHLTVQQMRFYHKSDSLNRSTQLNISKDVKSRYEGIGDFLLFLDSLGNIEKAKLVNIEISNSLSNRFFDWLTFIDKSKESYDIYSDVGIDGEILNTMAINENSKRIIRELLKTVKTEIRFSKPQSRIIYYSFSF